MSWTPLKAVTSGSADLGYVIGRYSSRQAPAGSAVRERGYYLRVWKRVAEGWRIVADITNAEPPDASARSHD